MQTDAHDTGDEDAGNGDPVYFYKSNLMGAPWVFRLRPDGLAWEYGRRSGLVRYDQPTRVRMSFRPATLQTQRFVTEIWSPQNPKLQIASTSFRGLMEQTRQDAEYTPFILELHRRMDAAGAKARFETGVHPILYWLGAVVFAGIGITLAVFMVRTLFSADWKGVAVIAVVAALLVWQAGMVLHRNRPQRYQPLSPPDVVLPRT